MMKKVLALAVIGVILTVCGGALAATDSAGNAPDYSQKSSWYKFPAITKDVDTFYVNSTAYIIGSFEEGASDYATLDNAEMLAGFEEEYLSHATVYEDSTNVFMPYYRQAGLRYAGEVYKKTGNIDAALSGIPYDDITAALDYYFENCNNGRPFIIVGHSQGSAIIRLVLKKYFKEHPDYYKRMVAAYAIGYSITKDDLKAYPHLKFATGETDTGVIISWNTEGKENVEGNVKTAVLLPGAISINPLNWKLDETYAPASENLGSLTANEKGEPEIADIGADAQIVLSRGTVLTNAKPEPMPEEAAKITAEFFGPGARHNNDYTFYYSNIKANVAKRIAAYKARPDYSQKASWYKIPNITKDVDTFYIYSTVYFGGENEPNYATLDNAEMLESLKVEYAIKTSAFDEATNVFVPLYRQAGMKIEAEVWQKTGSIETAISGMPYGDITSALDYYFEHYNEGRPFIIAGHSQGSAILRLVLRGYFKEHPEYYKRMIAAYAIGYSITRDDLEANPHMKFATGETDTGVIVSWHAEGPKNVAVNAPNAAMLPNGVSINPLNWKRDETYAPASMNLGSLVMDEKTGATEIRDISADAQVNLARGTVVTNANAQPNEMQEFAGPQSFHQDDYAIYYNNLKANVAKRIAAYKARGKAPDYSQKASWYKFPAITKDVDTFYVYATEYMGLEEGDPEYATLDNAEMLKGVEGQYMLQASAYEESSNVFVPYYRQAGMAVMKKSWLETGDVDAAISGMPYSDIISALDYYFENCNGGRPFIIAGHSQGSAIVKYALKHYFKEHPDYYKRMIAAYVIGYAVTKDDLEAYPHLKFATGEADTGVIISWNTEGKKNVEENVKTAVLLPNSISINPLNWKLDDTYAPSSMNLGSLVLNEKTGEIEIGNASADAQVVPERGVVVTNAPAFPLPEAATRISAEYFGSDGRHEDDYRLYYSNIKDNVAKRIAAYKAGR